MNGHTTGHFKTAVIVYVYCLLFTSGDGRLLEPPSRGNLWRFGYPTPKDTNENQLNCGGFQHLWEKQAGQCGLCGDPWDGPRNHEAGGKFATGIIPREYEVGQVTTIVVELTSNHGGYMEFRLCANNNVTKPITQQCLDENVLEIVGHNGVRYDVSPGDSQVMLQVKLPEGLTCSQCVLQWKYQGGDRWGTRVDGSICRGCGPQETFYGCADVTVARNVSQRVPSLPQNISQVFATAGKTYIKESPPLATGSQQKYLSSLHMNLSLSNIYQEAGHVVEKPNANRKLENLTLFIERNRINGEQLSGLATTSLAKNITEHSPMDIFSAVIDPNTQRLGSVSNRNQFFDGRGETLNSSFVVTELLTGHMPDFNWSNVQMPIAMSMRSAMNQMNGDREFTDSDSKVTATLDMTIDQVFPLKNNLNTRSSETIGGASALNLTPNERSVMNSHHIEDAPTSFQNGNNSSHFETREQEATTGDALLISRATRASLGTTVLSDGTSSFDGFKSSQNQIRSSQNQIIISQYQIINSQNQIRNSQNQSDVQHLKNISTVSPNSSRLNNVSLPSNNFEVDHVLKSTDRESFSNGTTQPVTGETNTTDLAPRRPIEIVRASQTVTISNSVMDGDQREVTIRISKMVPELGMNQTVSNNLKMTQEIPVADQAQNAVHISNIDSSRSQHVSRAGFNNVSSSLDSNIERNDERVNKLTSAMSHIISGSTNAQAEQTKSGVSVGEINALNGGSVEMKQTNIESQIQLEQVKTNTKQFSLETAQLSGTSSNVAISNSLDKNGVITFHSKQSGPIDNSKFVPLPRISDVVSNTGGPEFFSSVSTKLNDTQSTSVQLTTESFDLVEDGVQNTASTNGSNSHLVQINTNATSNLENFSHGSSNQAVPIQPHSLNESTSSNINVVSDGNLTASINETLVAISNSLGHHSGTNTTNSTTIDMTETRGIGSNSLSFVAGRSSVKASQEKAISTNAINLTLGSILTVASTNRSQWLQNETKKKNQVSVQQIDRETIPVTTDRNSTPLSESLKMADTNGSPTVEEKSNVQEKRPSLPNLNNSSSNQTATKVSDLFMRNVDMRETKKLELPKLPTRTRNLQRRIPNSHLSANGTVQLSKEHNTIPSFNQRKNKSVLIKQDMSVPFPSSLIKHTTSKIPEKQATQANGKRSPSIKVSSTHVNDISLNMISNGTTGIKTWSSDKATGKEWKLKENLRNTDINGGKTEETFQGSKANPSESTDSPLQSNSETSQKMTLRKNKDIRLTKKNIHNNRLLQKSHTNRELNQKKTRGQNSTTDSSFVGVRPAVQSLFKAALGNSKRSQQNNTTFKINSRSAMNVRLNPRRADKSNLKQPRNLSTISNSSSRTIIFPSRNTSFRINSQFQRVIDTRNRTTQTDASGVKLHAMRSRRPYQSRNINIHNEVTSNRQDSSRRPTLPNSRRNTMFGNVDSLQSGRIRNQNARKPDFTSRLNKDQSQTEAANVTMLPDIPIQKNSSNQGSESRNNERRLHPDNSNFQQISNRDLSSGLSNGIGNSPTNSNPNRTTLRPIPSSDARLLFLGARLNSRQLFPWNNRRRRNRNSRRRRMRRAVTLKSVINSDLAYQILENKDVSLTALLKFQNDLASMKQIKSAGELALQRLFRNNLSVTLEPKTSHLVVMDNSVQTDHSPPRANLEKD